MCPCELSLQLKNCQTETDRLARCIADVGRRLGLDRKTVFAVTLAIEELFTNIVSYGFQDDAEHVIGIDISTESQALTVRIEDEGRPFDPVLVDGPDVKCPLEDSKIGGLGIHLARKLMDEIAYERQDGKNIVILKKYI